MGNSIEEIERDTEFDRFCPLTKVRIWFSDKAIHNAASRFPVVIAAELTGFRYRLI